MKKDKKPIMKIWKRIGFAALGCLGLLALLCSIAAASITNQHLMHEGFLAHAETKHLDVKASEYESYAQAISAYLDGNADTLPETFSEKENLHMQDVRGIVNFLKAMRWTGGGLVLSVLAAVYLFGKENKSRLMNEAFRGFAYGSIVLLALAAGIALWGALDFSGMFTAFHQIVFTNDLWLLNLQTDLLVALMPEGFFVWYFGEMLKSLLPVLGIMLCLIVAWFKVGRKEA